MIKRTLAVLFGLSLSVACGEGGCGCEPVPTDDGGTNIVDGDGGVIVGSGLQVVDANARACEALFSVSGDEVPKVIFDSAVNGEFVPKAPRFAIAFTAASDASLVGEDLVAFSFATDTDASVTLVRAKCYDGSGNAIDGDPLTSVD